MEIYLLLCFLIVCFVAELKVTVKHKHNPKQQDVAKYNHTLATILVQYASAVRYSFKCII